MAYNNFAYYYDSLMDEKFYDDYLAFIKDKTSNIKTVLELACGTGEMSIRLAKENYQVYATDLSQDMLIVSRMKAQESDVDLMLARIDMTDFKINPPVNLVLCLCDSINYVISKKKVKQTFSNAFESLKPNGYFIFDANSMYKMNNILNDYYEEQDDADFYFEWSVKRIDNGEVKHHLKIVDKETNDKVDEIHHQKTLEVDEYISLLKEVGFNTIDTYSDFGELNEECERISFVCRKD